MTKLEQIAIRLLEAREAYKTARRKFSSNRDYGQPFIQADWDVVLAASRKKGAALRALLKEARRVKERANG